MADQPGRPTGSAPLHEVAEPVARVPDTAADPKPGDRAVPPFAQAAGSGLPLAERIAAGSRAATGGEPAIAAVARRPIHRKAAVGAVDDPVERHADQVADAVLHRAVA